MPRSDAPVWYSTVDNGEWECEVEGIPENTHRGRLTVTRVKDEELILDEEVGLSYGAVFGPDVDDVRQWEDRCIEVIDADNEKGRRTE